MSNLPVQWLWPGLCTSAGKHWGCVAQRWLRHLHIVAPEKQLVMWCWWHHYEWLTGGLWRCSGAYLVFLECGDVMSVNVTQTSNHHFYISECTLRLKFLAHTRAQVWSYDNLLMGLVLHICVCVWQLPVSHFLVTSSLTWFCSYADQSSQLGWTINQLLIISNVINI